MKVETKISRRKLFKIIASVLTIPFTWLYFSEVKTHLKFEKRNNKIELPANLNEGITFLDKIIVEKKDAALKIFSSRCTHLGCKINQEINNEFVCPCHGSIFDLDGNVVQGPAVKNLKKLKFVRNKKTGKIDVYA